MADAPPHCLDRTRIQCARGDSNNRDRRCHGRLLVRCRGAGARSRRIRGTDLGTGAGGARNAWRARGGVEVHVFSSPTALTLAQADRRIRCDLVVGLAGPAFEKAAKDETIDSDTTAPFASNTLVLIERGDPEGGGDAKGDVAALLAGKRLAIADPDRDVAGRYGLEALRAAGLSIDPFSRSVAVAESSAGVITFLAEGRADVGIVFATDARPEGFVHARMLADNTYPKIEYLIAAVDEPQRPPDDFLAFVRSEDARAILAAAGLRPPNSNDAAPASKAKTRDDR